MYQFFHISCHQLFGSVFELYGPRIGVYVLQIRTNQLTDIRTAELFSRSQNLTIYFINSPVLSKPYNLVIDRILLATLRSGKIKKRSTFSMKSLGICGSLKQVSTERFGRQTSNRDFGVFPEN